MFRKPNSPRHIALFLPDLAGGGAERVALASAKDLLANGHQVDLVLVRAKGDLLPLAPQRVKLVDLNAPRISKSFWPLVRYLKRERPDVLHAVMWPITVVAIIAAKIARTGTTIIVSEQVALSRENARSRVEGLLMSWTTRLLYPGAESVIACSGGAAEALAKLSGLPPSGIEVIYNPISPPKEIAPTPEAEAIWGEAEERLITVGSLKRQKNQRLMIGAFAKLRSRPRSKLMILGEGPLRNELAEYARSLGIDDRLIMPGFLIEPWPYLASADLFVMSSDWEGLPLALAEGMYAGLRIVSTNCPSGPAELLDYGRYGLLVPCGDVDALSSAIDRALREPRQPNRMRARAMEVAGPQSVSRYSELLLKGAAASLE